MSPFATFLNELRLSRDIRQADLAEMIGYERSYIAALEVGLKGPPTDEFIVRLVNALQLSPDELHRLNEAIASSQRKLVLDPQSSRELYLMVADLRDRIHALHPAQIKMIRDVLAFSSIVSMPRPVESMRIRRRKKEELEM
jgi:transcriptional regulator with XRE-family HTH domain